MPNRSRFTKLLAWLILPAFSLVLNAPSLYADKPAQGRTPATAPADEEAKIVAALPAVPAGLNPGYTLETLPTQKISATYTYKVALPKFTTREWVLMLPRPSNLPGQEIVRVRSTPAGGVVNDLTPLHQPLLRARVPADSAARRHNLTFEVQIDALLSARRLVAGAKATTAPAVPDLTPLERRLALRPTTQFDYPSAGFGDWVSQNHLVRAPREGEVDFARRVFQTIAQKFAYEYVGDQQDRVASHVATAGKSDCAGLCAVFVAALRAQGIPARTRAGRWAKSAQQGELMGEVVYFQEHVQAEFFAQGVGWVPADLSSAVQHDWTAVKLANFGRDRGNFVTIHLDTDFSFDTLLCGIQTTTLFQKACYWVTGRGDLKEVTIQEDWQVTTQPADKDAGAAR